MPHKPTVSQDTILGETKLHEAAHAAAVYLLGGHVLWIDIKPNGRGRCQPRDWSEWTSAKPLVLAAVCLAPLAVEGNPSDFKRGRRVGDIQLVAKYAPAAQKDGRAWVMEHGSEIKALAERIAKCLHVGRNREYHWKSALPLVTS